MKNVKLEIDIIEYQNISQLPEDEQRLYRMAINAADNAYAPYSNFKVGAAVLLDNEEIVTGNNQENGAYPSGLCAERVAVFYAISKFKDSIIKKIAIVAKSTDYLIESPVSPCGACRQVISEYEIKQKQPIKIIFGTIDGKILAVNSIKDLLPLTFSLEAFNK